ncbi:MAG: DUF1800 domain-containing protein [Alphaproteobacteria bacterium]
MSRLHDPGSPSRAVACSALRALARGLAAALAAWLLTCGGVAALTPDEARHLVVRTGFGASPAEIERLLPMDRARAVALIVSEAALPVGGPLPEWADDNPMTARRLDDVAVADALIARQGATLQAWWVERMLLTRVPLQERMTLFWHGHFASALDKVRSPQLMLRQNRLLRRHALARFDVLLADIAVDPAMLLYLDGGANVVGAPNENFAREVMELFTLGVGHYSEADVAEAARALTGWTVHPATGDALFVPARHDDGDKTILGRSGPWNGADVVAILLEQPRTAEFVAAALWTEFISTPPGDAELAALAADFRSDWRIDRLVRAILLQPAFWDPAERGAMIAGPVEWTVGTLRLLDAWDTPPDPVADLCAALGQALFEPPNVAGWPGGDAWIDPSTLAARQQAMQRFIAGRAPAAEETGLAVRRSGALVRWLDRLPFAWRAPDRLQALVLPIAPVGGGGAALPVAASPDPEVLADLARGWLADPAFQLK